MKRLFRLITAYVMIVLMGTPSSFAVAVTSIGMTGDYIKTAVSDYGTLGAGSHTNPGIQYALTTPGVFDSGTDYLTPGSPWEIFTVESTESGAKLNNNDGTVAITKTSLASGSSYDNNVVWSGTCAGYFNITNEYGFNDADKKIRIKTTITALTNLTNVKFARIIDPDPVTSYTTNSRGYDANSNGVYTDSGDLAKTDFVSSTGTTGYPLAMLTTSAVTHNAAITGWSTAVANYLAGTDSGNGDNTLGLGFDIGSLASGSSIELIYYYVFGGNLAEAVSESGSSDFSFTEKAVTGNQTSVGAILDEVNGGTADSDLQSAIDEAQALSSDGQIRSAMNQMSGLERPSLVPVANEAMSGFMGTVNDRVSVVGGGSGPVLSGPDFVENFFPMYNSYKNNTYDLSERNFALGYGGGSALNGYLPYGAWVRGYVSWGDREFDADIAGYDQETDAVSAGFDHHFSENVFLGICAGYSKSDVDYSASLNTGEIVTRYIGLYAAYQLAKVDFTAQFVYGANAYKATRNIDFLGTPRLAKSDYDGNTCSWYLEASKKFEINDRSGFRVMAGFQAARTIQDGYSETGAGSLNLQVRSERSNSYKLSIGDEYSMDIFRAQDLVLGWMARGRFAYELGDAAVDAITSFAGAPGDTFVVRSGRVNRSTGVVGTGIKGDLSGRVQAELGYDYALNEDYDNHVISFGLRFNW